MVQQTWTRAPVQGRPGLITDFQPCRTDSRAVETAAGIGFGLAVGRGSADDGCVLGQGAAATGTFDAQEFVGITGIDTTRYPVDLAHTDKYAQYDYAAVLTEGEIWVSPAAAVVDGGIVTFSRTTGRMSSIAAAADQPRIVGARWMTTASADGVAKVLLSGQLGAA